VDFDLTASQQARLDRLGELARLAAPARGGLAGGHDQQLAAAVSADATLVGGDLDVLDRVLLVEEASRLGVEFSPTALLLVAPIAGIAVNRGPVALVYGSAHRAVRDGGHATSAIDVSGDVPLSAPVGELDRRPVPSGLLHHCGVVTTSGFEPSAWACDSPVGSVYQLGLAAEIAGAAQAAIAKVAGYLNERVAFGQPLGALQALRHRLSERAVDAAGTTALVRYAAFHLDDASVAAAVAYATSTASASPPELHQLCGARGFVTDFGLSRWTMLMQALRAELGGAYDSAVRYAEARWAG